MTTKSARAQRLRTLRELTHTPSQRGYYLVCTDCGSLSIVGKRNSARTRSRPSHFRRRAVRRVRRPRKYVRPIYQRRQRQEPSALAHLLVAVAVVLIAVVAIHRLAPYS